MPVSAAPAIVALKDAPVAPEKTASKEHAIFGKIDPTKWAASAAQASREAQAELHTKGLSYVIGRDGLLIEVFPNGEEKPFVPEP